MSLTGGSHSKVFWQNRSTASASSVSFLGTRTHRVLGSIHRRAISPQILFQGCFVFLRRSVRFGSSLLGGAAAAAGDERFSRSAARCRSANCSAQRSRSSSGVSGVHFCRLFFGNPPPESNRTR